MCSHLWSFHPNEVNFVIIIITQTGIKKLKPWPVTLTPGSSVYVFFTSGRNSYPSNLYFTTVCSPTGWTNTGPQGSCLIEMNISFSCWVLKKKKKNFCLCCKCPLSPLSIWSALTPVTSGYNFHSQSSVVVGLQRHEGKQVSLVPCRKDTECYCQSNKPVPIDGAEMTKKLELNSMEWTL